VCVCVCVFTQSADLDHLLQCFGGRKVKDQGHGVKVSNSFLAYMVRWRGSAWSQVFFCSIKLTVDNQMLYRIRARSLDANSITDPRKYSFNSNGYSMRRGVTNISEAPSLESGHGKPFKKLPII